MITEQYGLYLGHSGNARNFLEQADGCRCETETDGECECLEPADARAEAAIEATLAQAAACMANTFALLATASIEEKK